MKKQIIIFILFFISLKIFAQQIGTCNKNVYKVGIIQENIPVCFYFEEKQGLIST